jgi:hypothetical protein
MNTIAHVAYRPPRRWSRPAGGRECPGCKAGDAHERAAKDSAADRTRERRNCRSFPVTSPAIRDGPSWNQPIPASDTALLRAMALTCDRE